MGFRLRGALYFILFISIVFIMVHLTIIDWSSSIDELPPVRNEILDFEPDPPPPLTNQDRIQQAQLMVVPHVETLFSQIYPTSRRNKIHPFVDPYRLRDEPRKTFTGNTDKRAFTTVQFVIPVVKRKDVGYKYVAMVVGSIQREFDILGAKYSINLFSTEEKDMKLALGSNIISKHIVFHYVEPDTSLIRKHKYWDDNMRNKQSSDWVVTMRHWKNVSTDEMFVYLEDDFVLCKGSILHLIRLHKWMKHNTKVNIVKFSYGGSGMLMRTSNLNFYLQYVVKICFEKELKVLDWALGDLWTVFQSNITDGSHFLHTYRYNLMDHIGIISSIGNRGAKQDMFRARQSGCFDLMNHVSVYPPEQFQLFECNKYMISPCRSEWERSIPFRMLDEVDISFDPSEYIQFKRVTGRLGKSCDTTCVDIGMICSEAALPLINGIGLKSIRIDDPNAPFVMKPFISSLTYSQKYINTMNCESSSENLQRICPCIHSG